MKKVKIAFSKNKSFLKVNLLPTSGISYPLNKRTVVLEADIILNCSTQ